MKLRTNIYSYISIHTKLAIHIYKIESMGLYSTCYNFTQHLFTVVWLYDIAIAIHLTGNAPVGNN